MRFKRCWPAPQLNEQSARQDQAGTSLQSDTDSRTKRAWRFCCASQQKHRCSRLGHRSLQLMCSMLHESNHS